LFTVSEPPMCVTCCFSARRRQPFFWNGATEHVIRIGEVNSLIRILIIMKAWHLDIIS